MGIWGKIRDQMIASSGKEAADKVMTAEEAEELDAALTASMAFDRLANAQYKKDIGLDKLQKLMGEPDKPTTFAGGQ